VNSFEQDQSLQPTELERIEINRLANESYALGSAVCCTYVTIQSLKDEVSAMRLDKWQKVFVAILFVGFAIDAYFSSFGLGFNLGAWVAAFSVLQLGIITIKAERYSQKFEAAKEKLNSLDLSWAKIHGAVLNNQNFLLGELRGAVEVNRFIPESDVFVNWCNKEYDRVYSEVAGEHKLAEKNKPPKSRLP